MKIKITLRDFLDTCCDNNRIFIRVLHSENMAIRYATEEGVYIMPLHNAWHNIDDECIKEEIEQLKTKGRWKDELKALAFTDDKFDIDEIYGEYADWNVVNLCPDMVNNPIGHSLDEVMDIYISKPTSI